MKVSDGQVMDFTKGGVPYDDARWTEPAAVYQSSEAATTAVPDPVQVISAWDPPVTRALSSSDWTQPMARESAVQHQLREETSKPGTTPYSPWGSRPAEVVVRSPFMAPVLPVQETASSYTQAILDMGVIDKVVDAINARRAAILSVGADTIQLDWVLETIRAIRR